jgi:hypothetical protein
MVKSAVHLFFIMRKTKAVKILGKKRLAQGLIPADFMAHACFPMSYYITAEAAKTKKTIKRDWKLKPKHQSDEELARDNILVLGIKGLTASELTNIKENNFLFNYLLSVIYVLTFKLNTFEIVFAPQKKIAREFAENLYMVSKLLNQEPYSLYTDIKKERPALQNPKRWDFNNFILAIGLERERYEQEKAMTKVKARQK